MIMKIMRIMIALLLPALWATVAHADTPAGTLVNNVVTIEYAVGAEPPVKVIAAAAFPVQEKLAHALVWQDAAPVPVQSGDNGRILTYELVNNGNGYDEYGLLINSAVGGNDFNPVIQGIYMDVNNSGAYDPTDTLYDPASSTTVVGAGQSLLVFVIANIPGPLADGSSGSVELSAVSNTVSSSALVPPVSIGDIIPGGGEAGTDAVVTVSGGSLTLGASFTVATYVEVLKSHVVNSPGGGQSQAVPGALITYTLNVRVIGVGSVDNLVITDPIPVNTTYLPGSMYLNTALQSDAQDAPTDNSDFNVSAPNAISVSIGTITNISPVQEIKFSVSID